MKKPHFIFIFTVLFGVILLSCKQNPQDTETEEAMSQTDDNNNTLSDKEIAEGWRLLFDGETVDGWRNYNSDSIGQKWQAIDGTLYFPGRESDLPASEGGDIITNVEFENFEFSLEWKISPGGNSGIFFNVVESDEYNAVFFTGPEIQILDNDGHADGKIETHRAGDLYDLISCSVETVKPVGEWNLSRVVVDQGNLQHWLNGAKVIEIEMWTEEWNEMVADSKFNVMPDFGKARKGHLALQDHGDPVWFRNLKVKEL